jgi:CubicO group peptidase (beta-lactamase class C family)
MACHGTVAPGFERVRDAFSRNFTHRGELGAACVVEIRGERVVDLWGGVRDAATGAPWEADTMVMVFSTTYACIT